MPTKTWAAGEDFNAVDINSYLQNQMVLQFANTTERASEIPNPTVGMVSFLSSTGGFEVFTDKTTPPSWKPPWNTAWGLVRGAMVYDIPLTVSPAWILTQLPVQVAGRKYKIEYDVNLIAANTGFMEIKYQTAAGYDLQLLVTNYSNWPKRENVWQCFDGAPTNVVGIIGAAWADAVTAVMSYGRVRVFDMGPI
jgi:hypothetical protein